MRPNDEDGDDRPPFSLAGERSVLSRLPFYLGVYMVGLHVMY